MSYRDMLAMLGLAAVWGSSFLFLRISAPYLAPWVLACLRITLAALVLIPLVAFRGTLKPLLTHAKSLAICGIFAFCIPFLCLSLAARYLPASLMSILNTTGPIWGVLLAWVYFKERLPWQRALGLLLGITGVVLLVSDRQAMPESMNANVWIGVLLMQCTTMSYAITVHYTRQKLSQLSALHNATGTLSAAALMLLPTLLFGPIGHDALQPGDMAVSNQWRDVPAAAWLAVAGLGLACTAAAQLVFYRLIAKIGPNPALTVTFLIPIFGMLWGALFLNERITLWMILSSVVIASGTWLSNQGGTQK